VEAILLLVGEALIYQIAGSRDDAAEDADEDRPAGIGVRGVGRPAVGLDLAVDGFARVGHREVPFDAGVP
jgi:hypothetical protein